MTAWPRSAVGRPARLSAGVLVLALLGGCSDGANLMTPLPDGGSHARRRNRQSPTVRSYPPHAIRSDGMGPYLVDEPLSDVLHDLPEGPRVELLQVGRLMNWKLVRTEEDALLIGADGAPSRVAFLVALESRIARTEHDLGVGKTGADLIAVYGAPKDPGAVVREHKIYEFDALPNVRFVTEAAPDAPHDTARVVAVVVSRPEAVAERYEDLPDGADAGPPGPGTQLTPSADAGAGGGGGSPCQAPALPATLTEIVTTAKVLGRVTSIRPGCVTGGVPEAIILAGDELVIVAGEPGKLRRVHAAAVDRADFLALIDVDRDGRHEIVLGKHRRDREEASLALRVYRWEGGRLVLALDERALVVSEAAAAAAGVTPPQVKLLVELRPARDGISVGGLLWARTFTGTRVLAPIQPVTLRVDPRRAGSGSGDRPVMPDAGPSPDAGRRGADAGPRRGAGP